MKTSQELQRNIDEFKRDLQELDREEEQAESEYKNKLNGITRKRGEIQGKLNQALVEYRKAQQEELTKKQKAFEKK